MGAVSPRMIAELLRALEAGHLSAAEALRSVAKGKLAVVSALHASRARRVGRPRLHRTPRYPEHVVDRAIQLVRTRIKGRSEGVRSVHWGARQVGGRRTYQTAVIVHVADKLSPTRVRATGRALLPKSIGVRHGGRRYVIPVDVQAVGPASRLHMGAVEPGEHGAIVLGALAIGALGGIVTGRDGQLYAVTAGHVADVIGAASVNCSGADAGVFGLGSVRCNRITYRWRRCNRCLRHGRQHVDARRPDVCGSDDRRWGQRRSCPG
jgi:hypothetical protein